MMRKKRTPSTFMAFTLAVSFVILPATLQAQSGAVAAGIPFVFHAGERMLPSGNYEIRTISPSVVKVTNQDTHESVFLLTNSVTENDMRSTARIVFNRYGGEYFISNIFWGDSRNGRAAVQSGIELDLAKNTVPTRVVSISKRR